MREGQPRLTPAISNKLRMRSQPPRSPICSSTLAPKHGAIYCSERSARLDRSVVARSLTQTFVLLPAGSRMNHGVERNENMTRSAARSVVLAGLIGVGAGIATAQQPASSGRQVDPPRLLAPQPGGSITDYHVDPPRLLPDGTVPIWPQASRALKKEGTVEISVDLDKDGTAWRVMLMESSGHLELDEATMVWVKSISFAPAKSDGRSTAFRDFRIRYEWKFDGPPKISTTPLPR